MNRTLPAVAVLAIAALLAIAGCGGSNSGSSSGGGGAYGGGETTSGATKPASSEAASGGAGVVSVAKVGNLGTVLVDSKGLTLYDFHKDKGGESACYGPCAQGWPPLTTSGAPQAMKGAQASMLGTTKRKDGTVQVTYAGHPLYTFVEDKKPGEANGNDVSAFGAQWYALQPNGEEPGD